MPYPLRLDKIRFIVLFLFFLQTTFLVGQDYRINNVLPYLKNDSIKIDLSVQNLFEGEIRKTLLTGIPIMIEFQFQLKAEDQTLVTSYSRICKITYDVWEEYFRLLCLEENEKNFQKIEEVVMWFNQIEGINLASVEILSLDKKYSIQVRSLVTLMSRKQSEQIKWWIQNSEQTEEDKASQERSTGFRLNLNKLVQLFFTRDEKPKQYVVSGNSGVFSIADLQFP